MICNQAHAPSAPTRGWPNGPRASYLSRPRPGLTLFELILAIALSSLVLLLLGTAIRLHNRALDTERVTVQQSQLARMLLRQMTIELRSTVNTALLTSDDSSAAVTSTVGQIAADNANTDSGSSTSTTGEEAEGESIDTSQPTAAGLYGSSTTLVFDASRAIPLPTQTQMLTSASASTSTLGQLHRISYYIGSASSSGTAATASNSYASANSTSNSMAGTTGLVRQAMDHAIAEWTILNGGQNVMNPPQLLAPEVVAIQFRYFDGAQWYDAWDSQQQAGLPTAVEITLSISALSASDIEAGVTTSSFAPGNLSASGTSDVLTYQTTVHLPASLPTDQIQSEY